MRAKYIKLSLIAIAFIVLEFLHILLNITRNIELKYELSTRQVVISVIMSFIVILKTMKNTFIEIREMSYGFDDYL